MDVSVVVPTFNRCKIVARTLETLFSQSAPASAYEVIAVVDGSEDGTADALRLLRPDCGFSVIEQENKGPSAARNVGFRAAKANLVLFLDDDMLCDSGLVAAHIAAHQGPEVRVAFGAIFLSADSPPSLASECFRREIGAFHCERKTDPALKWRIGDCVFSNASLSRALLEDSCGFDETYRKREDLELGIRLLRDGAKPLYLSNAIAYQYFEKTSSQLVREAESFAAADAMLARKYPDAFLESQLTWSEHEPFWKRHVRRAAAAAPTVVDLFLAPVCICAEVCFAVPAFRDLGVRALQMRRRIHWYNKALKLGWDQTAHRRNEAT